VAARASDRGRPAGPCRGVRVHSQLHQQRLSLPREQLLRQATPAWIEDTAWHRLTAEQRVIVTTHLELIDHLTPLIRSRARIPQAAAGVSQHSELQPNCDWKKPFWGHIGPEQVKIVGGDQYTRLALADMEADTFHENARLRTPQPTGSPLMVPTLKSS